MIDLSWHAFEAPRPVSHHADIVVVSHEDNAVVFQERRDGLDGVISGAVVRNDQNPVSIRLVQHAHDGLRNVIALIVGRHHYRQRCGSAHVAVAGRRRRLSQMGCRVGPFIVRCHQMLPPEPHVVRCFLRPMA